MTTLDVCTLAYLLTAAAIACGILAADIAESMSPIDTEHDYYLNIRDASNCTKTNDSPCLARSGCIHAYEYCQKQQCPEVFK